MYSKTKTERAPLLVIAPLVACAALAIAAPRLRADDWPRPPLRSGATLPEARTVSVAGEMAGLYVPERSGLSTDSTGIFESTLTWNFRIVGDLGAFGEHTVTRMWWANVSLLTFGHEVGLRYLLGDHLAFEAAYLGHRAEYEWVDGNSWAIGGVFDHGGEVGAWGRFDLLDRLRLEPHLYGRKFAEPPGDNTVSYTDHLVFGLGLRAEVLILAGHSVVAELELIRVYRGPRRRTGVDEITLNTVGEVLWRSELTDWFGFQLGARASTSWACGEVPMLEIKRSMIDEPMAKIFAGVYFLI